MKFSSSNRKSINYAILAIFSGFFFLSCLIFLEFILKTTNQAEQVLNRVENVLHKKEKQAIKTLNIVIYDICQNQKTPITNLNSGLFSEIRKNEITVQCYFGDSLTYWSDNKVEELNISQLAKNESICKLSNGWYDILVLNRGNVKAAALILLKQEYSFENDFLENSFQEDFNVPGNISITLKSSGNMVHNLSGNPLFSFDFTGFAQSYEGYSALFCLFLMLSFLSFCLALYFGYNAIDWLKDKPWLFVAFFTTDVIVLRLLQAFFRFPSAVHSTALFSPLYYSSSIILPSAGDYLFNSLILLLTAFIAHKKLFREKSVSGKRVLPENLQGWIASAFIFSIYILLCLGIDDLFRNSSFSLDLKDISRIGIQSIIGLLIVYCLSQSFFLLSRTAGSYTLYCGTYTKILFIAVITAGVFFTDLLWWDGITSLFLAVLFAAYLSLEFFVHGEQAKSSPFANFILPLVWIAILVTLIFNTEGFSKEKEKRKLIALRLASEKNPVTELLYNKLERRLLNDSSILAMSRNTNAMKEEDLVKKIRSEYIRDFWNRFTVQVTVCTPGKMLKIQPRGYVFNCEQYFRQVCDKMGEKTTNPGLYYLDYGNGIETYLGIIAPGDSAEDPKTRGFKIYMEFTAKTPAKDMGYPELLIDRRIMNIPDLSNYSYALYQNGSLVYKTGKYSYSLGLNSPILSAGNSSFTASDGMSHYRYNLNRSRVLIISKKEDSFLAVISPASYLFILFSFLTLFLNLLFRPGIFREFSFMSLKNRFQIANVGIIVISFLILGCLLLYFLTRLNNIKNMDSFNERTLSVMSEMQDKFGEKEKLDPSDNPLLEEDLQQLSEMFYTDVNVYSASGRLILSSRPQVFDEGLISDRMNITAFTDLKRYKQSAFFQDEKIGSYDYISAYFPLLNDKNELLAYVNLPFFSRQEDLKKEINDFLVAFMNLYILFILISVFVSFAISRYLSAPLGILVSRMEGFRLGKRNEKIDWNHHDEIGRLVEEYNRLIDELAFSAEQLARSERESAWREMARQVAHEIKNPLTPMKLSVQHLRKAWDEQSGDFNHRLQRFTGIMTEQIDSLSAIASEFSDFANMPLPVEEELDLIEIISSVISMYSGLENIQIDFESSEISCRVIGDKKQIIRVFMNLLNNSTQAISNKENGKISIAVSIQGMSYVIVIRDNGYGIPDEIANMIFLPNFTTKSGGAGLGLAIVKGIIMNMGGDITFVSGNEGTTFTITIPGPDDTKEV